MKKINDLKDFFDKKIVAEVKMRDIRGKYLNFKKETQRLIDTGSQVAHERWNKFKDDAEILFDKKVMIKIDKQYLSDRYLRFKNKVKDIVNKRFDGNYENFYIAAVGSTGVLCAILILTLGGSSSSTREHSEEEHEEIGKSIELSNDAIESSGIKLEVVKKKTIHRVVKLRGRISVNRDRYAKISSRYSGTVQSVSKNLGDIVAKGETLARVESMAARAAFDVRSGISGVIVDRQVVRGVFVSDKEPMFTVVDLATVWAELNASDTDFQSLKPGQKIKIIDAETGNTAESKVTYVSPNVHEDTQSIVIRAVIDNKDHNWRPGSFIDAEVGVEEKDVASAINVNAIQTLDDKPTIFVKHGDTFEARNVVIGTSDRQYVELISGATEGETYIGSNSFIAKAELLKSSAEHDD